MITPVVAQLPGQGQDPDRDPGPKSSGERGRVRSRGRRIPSAIIIPAVFVAGGSVLPALYVIVRTITSPGGLAERLANESTWELVGNTVLLAVAVTGSCLVLGTVLAILVARSNLPLRGTFSVLLNVPLVVPSFVAAFAYWSVLRPRGLVQGWLEPLGIDALPDITGFWGAFLVLTLISYPYVLLPLTAALRDLDPSVEDAARSLGKSRWGVIRSVVLPQVRPALAASGLLVALYVFADFGAVSLLRYPTLTVAIEARIEFLDEESALDFAFVLLALSLIVVAVQIAAHGRLRLAVLSPGARRSHRPLQLGAWRVPAALFSAGVVAVALAIPILVLCFWSWQGVTGGGFASNFWRDLAAATGRSLTLAVIAGVLAVAAALPVAMAVVRYPGRISSVLERATWVAYGLPGIVIAFAIFTFTLETGILFGSVVVLVLAYVLHFLPQALGGSTAAVGRLNPHYEEAARGLGRTWFGTLVAVSLPLLWRGLVAGGTLVFLNTMKELPMTLVLAPLDFDTLSLFIWSGAQEPRFYENAGIAGLVLIVITAIPMTAVSLREWRHAD